MLNTEDTVAADLEDGEITLDDVLRLFADDQVYVYATEILDPATAKWDDVDSHGAGSAELFNALRKVGASQEQKDTVMEAIRRASAAGRTIQSTWPKS